MLEKTYPRGNIPNSSWRKRTLGIGYVISPDTKKSVFVRKAHFELPPLTKTDVRNHTKNLSQRKHGWRNTKRVAPGNIDSLKRTGIRLVGFNYLYYT